jgi:hypothetical protein
MSTAYLVPCVVSIANLLVSDRLVSMETEPHSDYEMLRGLETEIDFRAFQTFTGLPSKI